MTHTYHLIVDPSVLAQSILQVLDVPTLIHPLHPSCTTPHPTTPHTTNPLSTNPLFYEPPLLRTHPLRTHPLPTHSLRIPCSTNPSSTEPPSTNPPYLLTTSIFTSTSGEPSHYSVLPPFLNAQRLLCCRGRDDKDHPATSCHLIFTLHNFQPDLSNPVPRPNFGPILFAQLSIFCPLMYTYLLYS